MSCSLNFLAGERAYQLIKEKGLSSDQVKVIAGAAGGPKWLVLNRLDRVLFTQWIQDRTDPLYLIGSSIGAWRFTAMCQEDPIAAQQAFETSYINQRYQGKPTPRDISLESERIIKSFINDKQLEQIFNHPYLRINFLSNRCKGLTASSNKLLLGIGFTGLVVLNLINRKLLGTGLERTLFHHPESTPPFLQKSCFPMQKVALTRSNYIKALLSSGSIPFLMDGIRDIAGAPGGVYRDGGLIDYHLDLPYQVDDDSIVLYPHFSNRIVPGWLDKQLKWRKPSRNHLKNVLLIAPTQDYIKQLPNQKIPDRNDFWLYKGRDDDRIKDWNVVVKKGEQLAEDFMASVSSGKIKEQVTPLF